MRYSKGKRAYGFCDRTGMRWPLDQLKEEYVQGKPTGLRVGPDVYDDDHPQNWFGKLKVDADPQALQDPRPDLAITESRRMWSFDPVGQGNLVMQFHVGRVTVT